MSIAGGRVRRFRLRAANAYLVSDPSRPQDDDSTIRPGRGRGSDDEFVLVDAGLPWDRGRLLRGLADVGLDAGDVDRVLLTHYDVDHVGTLATLGLRADVPIHVGEPDASYLTHRSNPPILSHKGAAQLLAAPLLTPPTNPVEVVDDGDRIGGFVAYGTPGHTPGHTAYVHERLGVAFVGDMVRETDGRLEPAPWVLNADSDQNRRSIREFAARCPPVDVVAMGHGDPIVEYGYGSLKRVADRV
ncbi:MULTISPECIES: MBL fold metallo-hydrolase [Haloferax]|uniref:MBL fold metallo-hydrolase n=1 Tax=Haloferax marinum TaxID=2666143 RepID=A0A6A8G3K7_9EURY|nr:MULTISPECIES: MBL fold metallo-hydrolase [Haloferax]KAB1196746.1 MBL fold metallo-hydrolase [Haloferax sp. CBA1150]MRW95754.1 MBL fold metallo-hydrolase [Haloferax marinum]